MGGVCLLRSEDVHSCGETKAVLLCVLRYTSFSQRNREFYDKFGRVVGGKLRPLFMPVPVRARAHVCVPPPKEIKGQTPSRVSFRATSRGSRRTNAPSLNRPNSSSFFSFIAFQKLLFFFVENHFRPKIRKKPCPIVYFIKGHVVDSVGFLSAASFTNQPFGGKSRRISLTTCRAASMLDL